MDGITRHATLYCDRTDDNVDRSWAAKVTGKKDLSLSHPDCIAEMMPMAGGHPDSPNYSIAQPVTEKSGYYKDNVFVEDFQGNKLDHYISPKPVSQMHQSMRNTFDACFDISLKKANDYSKGSNTYRNFEGSERIGISAQKGILLRMQDKFVRLENLLENDTPKVSESIEDTLMDLINYAAILKARREYEAAL